MSNTIEDWLEAQRINGGSHGFECIGIARMQQVWDAAREEIDLVTNVKISVFFDTAKPKYKVLEACFSLELGRKERWEITTGRTISP